MRQNVNVHMYRVRLKRTTSSTTKAAIFQYDLASLYKSFYGHWKLSFTLTLQTLRQSREQKVIMPDCDARKRDHVAANVDNRGRVYGRSPSPSPKRFAEE